MLSFIDRIIDVFPSTPQSQVRSQLSTSLLGVVSQRLLPKVSGGRVAAFEVLVGTNAVRNLIRDDKMHQARSTMESSKRDGMVTLDQSLIQMLRSNVISSDDAQRLITNPRLLT